MEEKEKKICKTEPKEEKRECCKDDCEVCVDDDPTVVVPPAPDLP